MSGAAEGVLVLGATNIPWGLDPAVRRRFERRVYIPLPDQPARLALLKIALGNTPHTLTESDLASVARRTEGLSGADTSVLVRDALMEPVRELQQATHFRKESDGAWSPCAADARGAKKMTLMEVPAAALRTPLVTAAHFERAVRAARPTVSTDDLALQDKFTAEFGSA